MTFGLTDPDLLMLLALVALILGCGLYLVFKRPEGTPAAIALKNAQDSIVELRTWGTYLITLQLAAIAGMGFLLEKGASLPSQENAPTLASVVQATPQVSEVRIHLTREPGTPKTSEACKSALPSTQLVVGGLTMLFFGASIVAATFLLGAIPSLATRLVRRKSTSNDVFHLTLFSHSRRPFVGPITGLQYVMFLCGVFSFSLFMYMRVSGAFGKC